MLEPFAQLFQHCWGHACSLRMVYKDFWVVSFRRCTAGPIRLHTTANRHATTPNIVGATTLGVAASVCTPVPTRVPQLPTLLAQQRWELLRPFARSLRHGKSGKKGRPSFRQLPLVLFLCLRLLNSRTQLSRRLQRAKIFHEDNGNCMFVE